MSDSESPINRLTELGKQVLASIEAGVFPKLDIPIRSIENITFDQELGQFVLGETATVRDASNIKHIRSFMHLMWVASYSKQLLESGRTSSLRDLYYSSEAFDVSFKNQAESDRAVSDLESLIDYPRESLGVFPEEHSSIYGQTIMRYNVRGYEGREVDLTVSPDGLPIGPALLSATPVSTDASLILAVESGGMFSRLIETKCWERFNCILVHLGGQAPRTTRRLLNRLHHELHLPVKIFTDGDPWGMHIAQVIIAGSANAAHIKGLTIPSAEWIGVTAQDIIEYDLPADVMTDRDLKRLEELTNDTRYMSKDWQSSIDAFRQLRRKAEQQAFSRFGMDFVVDEYLPVKLAI
ncbi:MAG: DNA topoisomerase IV subunit A [Candidatus Thorarchaeota archaeon]